jgi:hypothetical protein
MEVQHEVKSSVIRIEREPHKRKRKLRTSSAPNPVKVFELLTGRDGRIRRGRLLRVESGQERPDFRDRLMRRRHGEPIGEVLESIEASEQGGTDEHDS